MPAKEKGTRREADSQVNISLYLKKPEHILKLLLIFMPTSRRPPSSAGREGDAGERAPGGFGSWSRVTGTLPAIISLIIENDPETRDVFLPCFLFGPSWPVPLRQPHSSLAALPWVVLALMKGSRKAVREHNSSLPPCNHTGLTSPCHLAPCVSTSPGNNAG